MLDDLISVVVPVRNEESHVADCVNSILGQTYRNIEVLVVDGQSTDGTRAILASLGDSRVRVLDNARLITPCAMNIGIRAARGKYVAIFGAHAVYDTSYLQVCVNEIASRGLKACSGSLRIAHADTAQSRLITYVTSHWFGSSSASVRTQKPGFTECLPFPLIERSVFDDVGGYDEFLARNQDNDMNDRICSSGYRMYLTDQTHAVYWPQATVSGFLKHAFRTGYWNVLTAKRRKGAMRLRHFVPALFVSALLASLLAAPLSFWPLALVLGTHLAVGTACSGGNILAPALFIGFHTAYGLGSIVALPRTVQGSQHVNAKQAMET